MREESVTIYVTKDGKKFIDKEQAERHEKLLENTRYFKVRYNPDLNETGQLMSVGYIKVQAPWGHNLWAEDWLYEQFGNRIAFIQGSAPTENWTYIEVDPEQVDYGKIIKSIIV